MKICMFSVGQVLVNPTGGSKRFVELYKYLVKNNDVTLYSADTQENFKKNDMKNCFSLDFNKSKKNNIALDVFLKNQKVLQQIKKEKYDKVIVFDVRAGILLALKKIKNVVQFFRQDTIEYRKIILNESSNSKLKNYLIMKILMFCEKLCIKNSTQLCVQCTYDLNNLIKRHPKFKNKLLNKCIVQINNVNPSWIVDKINMYDGNEKKYDISFVGNFRDSRKGHDLLLKTIRNLYNNNIRYEVVIIGDGKYLEKYKNLYKDLSNIHFLGRLSNPIPTIKNSKLMVVPSYADSCPNTVMEALYYSVPVIGANSGGIPEILNDKDWIFDLNEKDLGKKIVDAFLKLDNLKKNQELRKKELEFNWAERVENKIREGE